MVDFGDEILLQSYRLPWLIWIQMIILILMLFVIYCVTIFSSSCETEVCDGELLASASSCCSSQLGRGKNKNKTAAVDRHRMSESQGIKGDILTGKRRRMKERDMPESEGLSTKDVMPTHSHPCHIIRLAKVAFLKCLGLEPDPNSS